MNILLVEDDVTLAMGIEYSLKNEGFNVKTVGKIKDAKEKISNSHIDIILLDVNLPDGNGYELCKEVRLDSEVPIIFLTACDEEVNIVMGLDLGADDYIAKPFNHLELVARVKSQLRRYQKPLELEGESPDIIEVRDLIINNKEKTIFLRGEDVKVTATEFKILQLLASNLGRVFSIKEIYEKVWEEPFYRSENTVTVHIRRIREKIEINTKDPEYIKVVWGVGYKIERED